MVDEVRGRVRKFTFRLIRGYSAKVSDKVIKTIETMIGKIARPKSVVSFPICRRARSGRLMRAFSRQFDTLDVGDITTSRTRMLSNRY